MTASPMDGLTETQLATLATALEALEQELEAALASSRDGARPVDLDQPIGRISRMDAMQQQAMVRANRRGLEIRLEQVHAAQRAMEEGEYGECRRCGDFIAYGRLEIRPEAPLCVACQESVENR